MNCIFVCVFTQDKYLELFYLLLESILRYGKLNEQTHLIVYTNTYFAKHIHSSPLFYPFIYFAINDEYTTIDQACRSRLDLFFIEGIEKYNKILYLDTDILVKDDLNKVFDVCTQDLLYVVEEGTIDSDTDFYGKTLFGDELENYKDKSAFTSGILLFHVSHAIQSLFLEIRKDMETRTRSYETYFYDQPFIVYHAFKRGIYENKSLNKYIVNNDTNIEGDKVVHHFPGVPGYYEDKLKIMTTFLFQLKANDYLESL